MKNLTIVAAMLAIASPGAALAQQGPGDLMGDKTISKTEADTAAAQHFDKIDANHDGSLAPEELEAGRPGGQGGAGGERAKAAIAHRMDADGDGKISKQEYVATQNRRFDMLDADKDGQLTKAERDAARARFQRPSGGGGWGGAGGSPDDD